MERESVETMVEHLGEEKSRVGEPRREIFSRSERPSRMVSNIDLKTVAQILIAPSGFMNIRQL